MRFSATIVASTLAVVARAQGTTTVVQAPTMTYSMDPSQSSMMSCIHNCDAADTTCIAACAPVPAPNDQQAIDTNECITKCNKDILGGNKQGISESQINEYTDCSNKCIKNNYYNSDGTPNATGGNNNNGGSSDAVSSVTVTQTSTQAESTATVTQSSGVTQTVSVTSTVSGTSTATQSGSDSQQTDSAASALIGSSAALFGLVAAVLAL